MNGEKILPTEYKYGSIIVRKASVSDFPALERMLASKYQDYTFGLLIDMIQRINKR